MPIFDQGYQHWEGELRPHWMGSWPIAVNGLKAQLKSIWTRIVFGLGVGACISLVGVLVVWGFIERKATWALPLLNMLREMPDVVKDPANFRLAIWTTIFHFFFYAQISMLMFLIMLIGPDLISKDLRMNAFPLYFSRPVRRFDYFLGKWGVIAQIVLLMTAAPAVIAWVAGVLSCPEFSVIKQTWHLPVGSILTGLVAALSMGLLMLAVSALTKNSRYVSAIWFALWIMGGIVSSALYENLRDSDWPHMLDLPHNIRRLEQHFLDTETAFKQFDSLMQSASKQIPGRMPMGRQARDLMSGGVFLQETRSGEVRGTVFRNRYPWEWSAAVLGGLALLSIVILHFRVKSLDRLK